MPDLVPNCLRKLSTDDTRKQIVNISSVPNFKVSMSSRSRTTVDTLLTNKGYDKLKNINTSPYTIQPTSPIQNWNQLSKHYVMHFLRVYIFDTKIERKKKERKKRKKENISSMKLDILYMYYTTCYIQMLYQITHPWFNSFRKNFDITHNTYRIRSSITSVIGNLKWTSGHVIHPRSLRMIRKSCIKAIKAPSATAWPNK